VAFTLAEAVLRLSVLVALLMPRWLTRSSSNNMVVAESLKSD
jgi:hypothetical protein